MIEGEEEVLYILATVILCVRGVLSVQVEMQVCGFGACPISV